MARAVALAAVLAVVLAGCGKNGSKTATSAAPPAPTPATGGPPWPAPDNAMELTRRAGLKPEHAEFLQYHVHAHLYVFVNGQAVRIPAGIGIDIHDPGVQSAPLQDGTTAYGSIQYCKHVCISPLHTHDDSGILHTETKTPSPNTLGQFFTEWNVRLDPNCVDGFCKPGSAIEILVDGKPFSGDPRTIELADRTVIVIVIGSPPATIPTAF
jgi:hypothetical protein